MPAALFILSLVLVNVRFILDSGVVRVRIFFVTVAVDGWFVAAVLDVFFFVLFLFPCGCSRSSC